MSAVDILQGRVRRARTTEAALNVLAAAGFGLALGLGFESASAGLALAAALGALFLSTATPRAAARSLELRDPTLDGAVTAFTEGGGGRLRNDLAAWVLERRPRASYRRTLRILAASGAAVVLAVLVRSLPPRSDAAPRITRSSPAAAVEPALALSVDVVAPAYAHRPAVHVDEPTAPIPALKGSRATLHVRNAPAGLTFTEEGRPAEVLAVKDGSARLELALQTSTALRIGDGHVVAFDVVPDGAPEVELTLPREDRTVTAPPGPFELRAAARDDLGLTSLAFAYTLAHGYGEGMTFKSGRIPGPAVAGESGTITARIDPKELGLGVGDTLVMWAEATDGNAVDGPSRTASSVRILRFAEDLAPIEMRSSAPAARALDGPLSQREILARTLRMLAQGLPPEQRKERSAELAEEQGRLRDAFGFFLRAEDGNAAELDHDDPEVAEVGSDRARKLLAQAVSAMWSSEAELATGNAQGSLPYQRLALKRIDEVFGNERYALRALAPPKAPVDEARRLKGDAKGLAPRTVAGPAPDPAPARAVAALARKLLLAAENPSAIPARTLADELWALPALENLSRSQLAAPLYAARTPEESARAARLAADALVRFLEPEPVVRPPVAGTEERLFTRLGQ
ncbi:MAG: hypothetical protein JNK60_02730 [Acidobacteria bacterium]|nr:hypothetical protein [Acidobacteriota bacterium]